VEVPRIDQLTPVLDVPVKEAAYCTGVPMAATADPATEIAIADDAPLVCTAAGDAPLACRTPLPQPNNTTSPKKKEKEKRFREAIICISKKSRSKS